MSFRAWHCFLVAMVACAQAKDKNRNEPQHVKRLPVQESRKPDQPKQTTAHPFSLADFYDDNKPLEIMVNGIYDRMPVQERAAQLIMPATGLFKDYGLPYAEILSLCRRKIIGGVLLLKGNTTAFRKQTDQINQLSAGQQSTPILFAMDGEPALIHRKLTDVDSMLPAARQYSDAQVNAASLAIANLLDKSGAHLNFAPVADRSDNTSIINRRSYGTDPDSIVHKSGLFITQHAKKGKACVIKHFPGHGAVIGDSHDALVNVDGDLTELSVFSRLLKNSRPAGLMMGHIAVRNNASWQTGGLPASLSAVMMKQLLRDSLQFNGLIFTDAMNMGAVSSIPGADFRALAAGADIVVMPQNVVLLHGKILAALQRTDRHASQLKQSVLRVIRLKICLGIINP